VCNIKISVIIPVYNREKSLRKCLDSVIKQTYENLEIILVDDGSQDNSGAICDDYAIMDKRFRVIHQPNAGVAAARNAGLAMATGDYIGWVDSDDWIEPGMYKCMLDNALEFEADIVVCSHLEQYENRSIFKGWQQREILDTEQALGLLLQDDIIKNYLWDKLWHRELFDDVRFPDVTIFEDMAVMYKLFVQAKKVVCLPNQGYNYLLHSESLTANSSWKSCIVFYFVVKNRYDELRKKFPQFADLLACQCVSAAAGIWAAYYSVPCDERRVFNLQLKEIGKFCKQHYRVALQKANMGLGGRLVMRLTPYAKWWAFALACLVNRLYKLKHGRNL